MFENVRWGIAYLANFDLGGLSVKVRIMCTAVSCALWAGLTVFGVI